jgi:hypothetical protein
VHDPSPLVERTVPGGLVTRHRLWYHEERAVHGRLFSSTPISSRDKRRVRASRAMLFARIAFGKGDIVFGLARLTEAVRASPLDCVRIAAKRFVHGRRHVAKQARKAGPMEAQ